MTTEKDTVEDRIADALVGDSAYEKLRVRRFSYFKQPLSTKLAWQSLLLASVALFVPAAALFPASITDRFLDGTPLVASPTVVLLAAFVVVLELLMAAGHVAVAAVRVRATSSLTDRRAARLLGVEDVASLLGLGTGTFAVAVTNGFFYLGFAGADAVAAYVALGGGNPFSPSGTNITVVAVGTVAAVGALAVFGASRVVSRRL